jgi:transposase
MTPRKPYPTNVSDEEWAFAAPYLTLMTEQAPQRKYDLRAMFNALRWMARAGAPWRLLPNDFPPWEAVYQQTQRWLQAGCFEAMVNDLRSILRVAQGKQGQPVPPSSMGGRCNRPAKADHVQATTDTSARRAARCIWRSIRWAICWRPR